MGFNLIDIMESQLSPQVVQRAGEFMGATPAATQKTLDAAVPSLVGGLANVGSTEAGSSKLLDVLKRSGDGLPIPLGGATEVGQRGQDILGSLLGDKFGGLSEAVGQYSGVGSGAAGKLLKLLAPLCLGLLGKHVRENGVDARGLQSLMGEQKENALRAMPPGLAGVSEMVGLRKTTAAGDPGISERVIEGREPVREKIREPVIATREPVRTGRYVAPEAKRRSSFLPVALGILGLLAVWGLLRSRHHNAVTAEMNPVTNPAAEFNRQGRTPDTTTATRPTAGTLRLSGPSGLMDALNSGGPLPQRIAMTTVVFSPGTSNLDPTAQAGIASAAQALRSHPSARIRVEGRSDAGSRTDLQLAQQRADAVRDALVSRGVPAGQVQATGTPPAAGGDQTVFMLLSR